MRYVLDLCDGVLENAMARLITAKVLADTYGSGFIRPVPQEFKGIHSAWVGWKYYERLPICM